MNGSDEFKLGERLGIIEQQLRDHNNKLDRLIGLVETVTELKTNVDSTNRIVRLAGGTLVVGVVGAWLKLLFK